MRPKATGYATQNQNAYIAAIIIALALVGMFFYGKQYFPISQELQRQYIVSGNGVNIQNAFDTDLESYWEGDEGGYGKYYYATVDFGEPIDVNSIKLMLGGEKQPVNYWVTIQTSLNGNIWNDVIGASETGYFNDPTQFKYNFLTHKAKYVKIGVKLQGIISQKMRVYDIKVNQ